MSAVERARRAHAAALTADRPEVWTTLRPLADVVADATAVDRRVATGESLALAGLVVAVKNNIDVAGIATTAACPGYSHLPERDATAVARLKAAGAVVLGATNLDQFATGLVGTRSPYGAVRHATHPERVSGGSSSGSAVAVALGLVDAALGTDTAGSGRVPAAFHGLYGVKPTRGVVPLTGVVPACRSLDVVTVLDTDLDRAGRIVEVMAGADADDPQSARSTGSHRAIRRIGIPDAAGLGSLAPGWVEAFAAAAERCRRSGAEVVSVDIAPLLAAARLLYEGSFVAERFTAVGAFVRERRDDPSAGLDPTVAAIIDAAGDLPAWRVFADQDTLAGHRRSCERLFETIDALLLPTTVRHPLIAEVAADPVGVNAALGRFTNFVNLLDLAALAFPAGRVDGLPFGVQLVAPAGGDGHLVEAVHRFEEAP